MKIKDFHNSSAHLMQFIDKLYEQAKKAQKRILLPEGEEVRVLKSLELILRHELCTPVIIGDPDKISRIAKKEKIDLKNTEIIDRKNYKDLDKYVSLYCEIRKHKKIKPEDARKLILDSTVFYAALAVRTGEADGFVAGAAHTTRNVARAAIHCIGASKDTPTVSSSSIMILPDKSLGSNGVFIFADAGIVPDPTA